MPWDESPVVFDPATETYRTSRDPDSDHTIAMTVVKSVAAITDRPTTHLAPIYRSIDPDALEDLFEPISPGARTGFVRFHYEGYCVTVHADGQIELEPLPRESPASTCWEAPNVQE